MEIFVFRGKININSERLGLYVDYGSGGLLDLAISTINGHINSPVRVRISSIERLSRGELIDIPMGIVTDDNKKNQFFVQWGEKREDTRYRINMYQNIVFGRVVIAKESGEEEHYPFIIVGAGGDPIQPPIVIGPTTIFSYYQW